MMRSKPLTPAQQRKKLKLALDNELRFAEICKGDTNPQVIEMYTRAKARAEALEAVLDMMHGNNVLINIMSEKKSY